MHISTFILSIIGFMNLRAFANDICLWDGVDGNGNPGQGCVGSGMCCRDIPAGQCCTSGAPFNQYVSLDSNGGTDLYGWFHAGCSGRDNISNRCGAGQCCFGIFQNGGVAGQWYVGQGGRSLPQRREVSEDAGCAAANQANYVDDDGVPHSIRIPDNEREHFFDLWEAKNYTGLAEFPDWKD